jgi:hypothetical protein
VDEREGQHSEIKERDTGEIFQIEGSLHIEENIHHLSSVEEDPTQIGLCIEPTTMCMSPRIEVRSKVLSIVVSGGSKYSIRSNQSSGSSASSLN